MPLDPEVSALLERLKSLPPRSTLDVAATRDMMRRAGALAGEAPPLPKVRDILLPGRLGARQYWPSTEEGQPIAVYFHGGRFFSGDLESHDTICRLLALAAGCRVVAVDYRLAPEYRFPAAVEDACRAVEWPQARESLWDWPATAPEPTWLPWPPWLTGIRACGAKC